MRRTGIDVSATGCLLVDAECLGRRRKGEPASFRVHAFASVPNSHSPPLASELRLVAQNGNFSRRAWVNLWDVRSSHEYTLLPSAREADVDTFARHRGASTLELDADDVAVATALGRTRPRHSAKKEVSFFAASAQEIREHIRPIADAGFIVEGVTTPCGALWSQARLRRPPIPGDVHAFVALAPFQSAIGIFADGFLLYGRDLEWGYAAPHIGADAVVDREELATRLSFDLQRSFLYVKQFWEPDVSQVMLCGDMPNIRSLTAPLIERLNLEVETLDTLEGIDPASLPIGFAERAAAFRLASAIAVEPPPANLLPFAAAAGRRADARRVAAAGSAVALLISALLYGEAHLRQRSADRQIAQIQEQLTPIRPASGRPDVAGPAMISVLNSIADAAPRGLTLTALRVEPRPDHWKLFVEAYADGPQPADARRNAERFLATLASTAELGEPLYTRTQDAVDLKGIEVAATYRVRPAAAESRSSLERQLRSSFAPAGNAHVTDIVVSPGRSIAVLDGRIVRPGDGTAYGVVGSIESDAVLVISPDGETHRISRRIQ